MRQNLIKLLIHKKLRHVALATMFCVYSTTTEAHIVYPEIAFIYDWRGHIIDSIGCLFFKKTLGFNKIDAAQKEQFKENIFPSLLSSWNQQAPMLFGAVFSCFNCGFKQKNRTSIITLGNSWSYGSKSFLILGLFYYLDSVPWKSSITKEDAFAMLVFHELLHIWVDDNVGNKSALLTKYGNEHLHVREHIHLMAIQKMVYHKLNRPDMIQELDESYRKFSMAEYRRAWEIVNDIEGYKTVIQDILDTLEAK